MGEGKDGGKVMTTKTIARARNLRKRMTDTEIKLWQALRLKQIMGIRFRRQAPLGKYIVDFVSHENKLIIELDGGHIMKRLKLNMIQNVQNSFKHKGIEYNDFGITMFYYISIRC